MSKKIDWNKATPKQIAKGLADHKITVPEDTSEKVKVLLIQSAEEKAEALASASQAESDKAAAEERASQAETDKATAEKQAKETIDDLNSKLESQAAKAEGDGTFGTFTHNKVKYGVVYPRIQFRSVDEPGPKIVTAQEILEDKALQKKMVEGNHGIVRKYSLIEADLKAAEEREALIAKQKEEVRKELGNV